MEVLIVAVLLGLIPAFIARGKGRSFIGWWIYGALIFIIAVPHALFLKTPQSEKSHAPVREPGHGEKKCCSCSEVIPEEAKICPYCHRDASLQTMT